MSTPVERIGKRHECCAVCVVCVAWCALCALYNVWCAVPGLTWCVQCAVLRGGAAAASDFLKEFCTLVRLSDDARAVQPVSEIILYPAANENCTMNVKSTHPETAICLNEFGTVIFSVHHTTQALRTATSAAASDVIWVCESSPPLPKKKL